MARSMNGSNPFVARRLLGPSPSPHIEFPVGNSCSLSKQYDVFCCCSLKCLCVISFSVISGGAKIFCTSQNSCSMLWKGKRWYCLKLCDSRFSAVSKAFFCMASYWLKCWHTLILSHVVLSPLLLLSSGLSPNLLYMWWRNKIS